MQRKAGNGQRRTDQAPFWQLPRHALESRIPDVKPRAGAKSGPGLLPFFISLPCAPYPLFFFYQPCRARPTPVCEIRVFRHHPPRGRLFEGGKEMPPRAKKPAEGGERGNRMLRRSHKKSRNGCLGCKQRHIKVCPIPRRRSWPTPSVSAPVPFRAYRSPRLGPRAFRAPS